MSGIPTVTVEISSSFGWEDVSNLVLKDRGITMSRGRSNEFETSSPGTLSFTLRNNDPENQFGIGGVLDGFGYVKKNTPVRVKVGATQVWQGRIDSWRWTPSTAPGGSVVEVTATDEFKTYAKAPLYPYGAETMRADTSSWTAGEVYLLKQPEAGRPAIHPALRNPSATALTITEGTNSQYSFGTDAPPHVKYSINLNPDTALSDGITLNHPISFNPGGQNGLVSFWFRTSETYDMTLWRMYRTSGGLAQASITLDGATGQLTFYVVDDSANLVTLTPTGGRFENLNDGQWHHVACWFYAASGTTVRPMVDGGTPGTSSANSGGTALTISSTNRVSQFGRGASTHFKGDMALPGVFTRSAGYTWTGPSSWFNDGMNGGAGLAPDALIEEFYDFIGQPSTSVTALSTLGFDMVSPDLDGKSLLEAAQIVADSELGVFFYSRTNTPRLHGYLMRATSTITLTVSAVEDLAGADVELVLDDSTYANTVIASSPTATVVAEDTALVASDGIAISESWECVIKDSSYLSAAAYDRLEMRKTQVPRLGRIDIDLLTSPNAIESGALTLRPLDQVRVTDLDAELFGATTYDGIVEGWELEISTDTYRVSLDLSVPA